MAEQETREPYEKPELIKLDNIREITAEDICWTCSYVGDPFG